MAASGADALTILQEQSFDLLVTDLNMPAMNGIELIRRAKPDHPRMQFVIVSANKSQEMLERALQLGIIAFLYKPLSLDELLAAIDQGLAAAS